MRRFGNVALTKEDTRAVWARVWLEQAIRDVRFAFRTLVKKPLFVVVAAATIALGIGAATVVFSIVDSVLLRPLPYRDPDDIVLLLGGTGLEDPSPISVDDLTRHRNQNTALEGLAFYGPTRMESPETDAPVAGAPVDASVFDVLGVRPVIGSTYSLRLEVSTVGNCLGGTGRRAPELRFLADPLWRRSRRRRTNDQSELDGHLRSSVSCLGDFSFRHTMSKSGGGSWYTFPLPPYHSVFPVMPTYHAVGRLKADTPLAAAQAEIDVISRRSDGANATPSSRSTRGSDRLSARLSANRHALSNSRCCLRQLPGGALGPDGRRRTGAPDSVRQCCQPVAGPGRRAGRRVRSPDSPGRRAHGPDPATRNREPSRLRPGRDPWAVGSGFHRAAVPSEPGPGRNPSTRNGLYQRDGVAVRNGRVGLRGTSGGASRPPGGPRARF